MNKKVWIGAGVVFVLFAVLDFVVHGVLLSSEYAKMPDLFRPMEEMKMWIFFVTYAFVAYFFTLIFSKGYENKGIAEGVRYGVYVGFMMTVPMAYGTYGSMPITYALALQWFLYGMLEFIICGVALAIVFKPKAAAAT
ncbi:MAG: hypothetical protein HYW57_01060 [Ignavibacteriales bacterium]|nr:hypothetical protein [Ignavibacteriales bacterium]